MDAGKKAIWIDLDNSPHVPLFAPIIKHYRENGVDVVLTARSHSQTIELLNLKGFDGTFETIGKHYGKSKAAKVRGLIERALQLSSYIKKIRRNGTGVGVAVSHGSRSMVLAAWWLKIPVLTMYDYEYTETRSFNRFSDRVLIPDAIPDSVLDNIGLPSSKRVKYSGIKEELYARDFDPDDNFRRMFLAGHAPHVPETDILVVIRPPATTANYHAAESEAVLAEILAYLSAADNTFTIVVPRTKEQASEIRNILSSMGVDMTKFLILSSAVDGLSLAYASDLLISGGGTMNREAALLGVPVYSIFAGRQGALDAEMERTGVITFIRSVGDVAKINLVSRDRIADKDRASQLTDRVERSVIEQINSFLNVA